jgi:hypothetical protein
MLSMAQSETDSCWQECTATLILYCYPIGVRISNILLQTQLVLGQFGRGASPTLRLISDEDKPPEGFLTRNSSVTQNVTRTKVKEPIWAFIFRYPARVRKGYEGHTGVPVVQHLGSEADLSSVSKTQKC